MAATIAVLMTAYREREDWIASSIDSVLCQTWPDVRLYIVYDDPRGELEPYLDERGRLDQRITLVKNETNMGLVGSLNRGLGLITESFVARLDADDIAEPDRLERQMAFMEKRGIDFVMTPASYVDDPSKTMGMDELPELDTDDLMTLQAITNYSVHSSWLMKREVFEELGGYRDIPYCEDLDLVLRGLQADVKMGRMRDPLVRYRTHEASISSKCMEAQRSNAELLHRAFSRGIALTNLDLSEMVRDVSQIDMESYADARLRMANLSEQLTRKRYIAAAANAVTGCFSNAIFRATFLSNVAKRVRLSPLLFMIRRKHARDSSKAE